MESKISQLIKLVQKLPESCLEEAIEFVSGKIEEKGDDEPKPPCPHCKDEKVSRFGQKGKQQRYRCKSCNKTFVGTTNTVMYQSQCGEAVWKHVIRDTVEGTSLEETAESIAISQQTVFRMRHKILLALEADERREPTVLSGVCELDDTYVLESYKGAKLPPDFWRKPRRHGAVAQKPGISNEYVAICTGVERDGDAYSATVTRATPGSEDVIGIFEERIGSEALILCDGAKSYTALGNKCECPVQNVSVDGAKSGKGFYNINTANGFHSFIKERYNKYRGVATKYLNRYNTLFSKVFRSGSDLVDEIYNRLTSNDIPRHHSIKDVKTMNLLDI